MSLEIGEVIQGRYRIVGLLGQGGMGAVYEGENTAIARRVAIKVLFGTVASQQGVVERFEREAQAAGRIGNDHILEVLDMGDLPDGNRFMVMEFLDGETLGERTKRLGPLSPEQIYPLAKQLLTGLGAAHRAGIIHRDLKPENIFVLREKAGQKDFVKIIDFGISKFTTLDQDMKMTATGAVMGTPYFMSPEQAKGSGRADPRSDLYAVGVILYKAVTGQVPFDGETFNELLFKIVLAPLPQPRALVPELDPAFESIIQKAMARDLDRRFQTAEEFIQALDAWKSTGAAVSIPPPEDSAFAGSMLGDPSQTTRRRGGTQIALTPSTGSSAKSWTQPDVFAVPRKPSNTGLWIGAAVLGALILGGLGLWLLGGENSPGPELAPAAEVSATQDPVPELPTTTSPAPSPTPQVVPIDPEPSQASEDAVSAEVTAEPQPAVAPVEPPSVKPARPVARTPVARTPTAPAEPPKPNPKPAPPPRKGGSPDFGY